MLKVSYPDQPYSSTIIYLQNVKNKIISEKDVLSFSFRCSVVSAALRVLKMSLDILINPRLNIVSLGYAQNLVYLQRAYIHLYVTGVNICVPVVIRRHM